MTDVTVKQLAETVGATTERLLRQMQEAGMPHTSADDTVSEDEKQALLAHLKRSHGESTAAPRKITLTRKSRDTLKTGQGRAGRSVTVEVRRKKTYVKRAETPAPAAEETPATADAQKREAPVSQLELEAQRIREQEAARKQAEEDARRVEAERKAEEERRKEEVRLAEEKAKEEARLKAEREKAQEQRKTARAKPAPAAAAAAPPAEDAASADKSGKHRKGRDRDKEKERHRDDDFGKGRRRELRLKGERKSKRKGASVLQVDREGGEFNPNQEFASREIAVPDLITVGDLAQKMSVKAGEVIKKLMSLGVMATINQALDQDTATLVVEEFGHRVRAVSDMDIEQALEDSLQIEGEAVTRAPVVTVMGHVDHGKTSLLDYIRKTRVVSGEAGGITQHIGAYRVATRSGSICFIDTPGHAAFTAMRARGAKVTDIVILVVAADDGVMPQTQEAIQHAKAAGVPIIVAINKMDLEGADPERVTNELASKDVIPEEWGGDTQFIKVSALTGDGIDALLEAISLQAEILELRAIPEAPGRGVVIESRLDRGRGPVSTVLVQNGTLRQGDVVIAGEFHGRVRAMIDDQGNQVKEAGPSMPVELLGLGGTPAAGDDFSAAADERTARELAEFRRDKSKERSQAIQQAAKLDNMFANLGKGEKRVLKMVLKADVRGSLEALVQSLADLGNDEVSVSVLGSGVGGITETDVNMALTYGAVVFGFNVRADSAAKTLIERENVDLRYYSVIYELLDDVKQVLSGMLAPEVREEIIGVAEVRDVFRSPRFGQVAGCMVLEGNVLRHRPIRVLRDNVVIFQGELESLRRFKDDVNEVRSGTECGIGVRNYNDIRPGDRIEVYESKEVARAL